MIKLHNKIHIKLISIFLIQAFLITGLVYPEPSSDKNISSLYIYHKGLRVPMMNSVGSSDGERVKRAFEVIGKEVNTIIDSFTPDASLGVLEGSVERLLKIIKSLPENARSKTSVYIIERLLGRYTLDASPMWSTYLNSAIAEIVAIDSKIAGQVIGAIIWEMASETDPRILLNLKEALSLDGMIKDSPEIHNYIQLLERASRILHGIKDMIKKEDLKKNLKPLLAEKISIVMGFTTTPQGLRVLALQVLFREGLLDDSDLEAMMLHEIIHAERGDEKIWPELVKMDDKKEAIKKVRDIEYEVDRSVVERLMEYGKDPEAYLRLLEKSDDLIRQLAQEGHLKPSNNPMAIPTPPIKDRIKNIKMFLIQKGVHSGLDLPGYASFIEKYTDGTFIPHIKDAISEVRLKGLGNRAFNEEELKKISQLETQVKENVKLLRDRFKLDPDYFTQRGGEEGVIWMIKYMKLMESFFIGYGDMKKIFFLNKAFAAKLVDRLIPLMAEAANYILSQYKYKGLAVRTTGDEMALGIRPELSEREVNNIRLELQYTLAEFIPYYGFVKLNGVKDDNVEIIRGVLEKDGIVDIYKDEDGFFLVFDVRKAGNNLNASCEKTIKNINTAIATPGFDEITQDGSPVEIPSPRANFGIIKSEIENTENSAILHAEYGRKIKYAEYIHSIAEEHGLNGGTSYTLEKFDDFSSKIPEATIPRLSESEQEMKAKMYSDQLGAPLYVDQFEEYYPAIKREYLHTIIRNMPSSQPGSVFLVRGPPDNFYIAANLEQGYFSLLKLEFLYKPSGAFKVRVHRAKKDALEKGEDIEGILRERWPELLPEWYGFKIINDYLVEGQTDHVKGNGVILAIANKLNAILMQDKYLSKPAIVTERGLKDFAREVQKRVIKAIRIPSNVKVIVGMVKIETSELKEKGPEMFIKIADDLTKIAMPLPRSDNIINIYDPAREKEFYADISEYRKKERGKFQVLLKKAYDEPVLTTADLKGYTLAEGLLYEILGLLSIQLGKWDFAFKFNELSKWFDRLETSLSLSKPEVIESFRLKMNEIDPKTKARIAYNIERLKNEKDMYLLNLRKIFDMPKFYEKDELSELSIISYMATYFSVEEISIMDFGVFKLIEKPLKKGEDYIFKFKKENALYVVRLKKDFSLELETTSKIAGRKDFYMQLTNDVVRDLEENDKLCYTRSVIIVKKLFEKHKIRSVIMEERIGGGAHYWIETQDNFIIDAFPLGRQEPVLLKIAEALGNKDIVVIDKNAQNALEKEAVDKFYKQGKFLYEVNKIFMNDVLEQMFSSALSAMRESL